MKDIVKWMAGNHVAANILMIVLVAGGLIIGKNIKQEVFPEFELDIITISVPYPGASPDEVEDGIILPLENAISSVDNIKRVTATASEGVGIVMLEVIEGSNVEKVLNDVKSEVDRIITFPGDAEKPIVSQATNRRQVITLVVLGDVSELALYEISERIRDDLLSDPGITQVELASVRAQEISIEISEESLRRFNLTLNQVASIIRTSSLDMPGGSIKAEGGEILIRTKEKRYFGTEYDSVAVFKGSKGEVVYLKDIAKVKDSFADVDLITMLDGKPAAMVEVYRVGKQTPKGVARIVKDYIETIKPQLPTSVDVTVWSDRSELLQSRIDLLFRNGFIGMLLVLFILALFLEIRLAFWVAMGIAISFLGALIFMPMFGVSINMMSLFGFLTVLGIVVDDAIIVGENIFVHYRRGIPLRRAAVLGTNEILRAVVFAVLTSVVAFSPLLFTSGTMGKFMGALPIIVITVLIMSLIESLFILPSHLSSALMRSKANFWLAIEHQRSKFDKVVDLVIKKYYFNTLTWVSHNRYITVGIGLAVLLATSGLLTGGKLKFVFMPTIDADWISVSIKMEPGTSFSQTKEATLYIQEMGEKLAEEYAARPEIGRNEIEHIFTTIGASGSKGGPIGSGGTSSSNMASIRVRFLDADERNTNLREFGMEWRKRIKPIPNMEAVSMQSQMMGHASDIDVQLAHEDFTMLQDAVEHVKTKLAEYDGVYEVIDTYSKGKTELKLQLKPEAAALGLTETDLAQQVRGAFYGSEALRIQRGRNEVRVIVRYPESDRSNITSLEQMRLRTPTGGEISLEQAAYITESRGYSQIQRTDRKRVINVQAKSDRKVANPNEVLKDLTLNTLDYLAADYPGLSYDFEGDTRDRNESMVSLGRGFLIALFVIYALLAIPFRSFTQPFIVMSAIPFGFVGAFLGHVIMGYQLSLISAFGIVALSGIVVNDSLVMIDFINTERKKGHSVKQAVMEAGQRRFRPIILTSLTTFFGLSPMMLETSMQARFLVPMVISLGFGVLFATGITLVLIPALYLILNDIHRFFGVKSDEEKAAEIDAELADSVDKLEL